MKQIMEYYGNVIIALIVATTVLGMFSMARSSMGNLAEKSIAVFQVELGENDAFMDHHSLRRGEEYP